MPTVSVVIRAKNEERWIGRCLRLVFQQEFKDFEVILVDNKSTDHTVAIAKKYPVKIISIDQFRPGKAINVGVRASEGQFIVCLSAHCIPKDAQWLTSLLKNMEDPSVAGVYGRQLPMSYSSDLDKRDLLITFGLDRRVQIKDGFFHNANSMARRSVWEEIPFDEEIAHIEDRLWGEAAIKAGHRLVYEPEAAVYHYHGIHQNADKERAKNIVRILESFAAPTHYSGNGAHALEILAVFPVLGPVVTVGRQNILDLCLKQFKGVHGIKEAVVISENRQALELGERYGFRILERPQDLLKPEVGLEQVLQYALRKMEEKDHFDAVFYANYLFPFRPAGFFTQLIEKFTNSGVDSLVPTLKDYAPCWIETDGHIVYNETGLLPRERKKPVHRGLIGLGTISSSDYVRAGHLLGNSIALLPVDDVLYSMKASEPFARTVIEMAFAQGMEIFGSKICVPA